MNRGRTPLLEDQQLVDDICKAIEEGCSYKDAAASVGISKDTLLSWMAKGKRPKARACYISFLDRITHARAKGKRELIRTVYRARKKDWRAATHMLAVIDSDWCLQRIADERRVTNHILDVAKEALGKDAYEKLLDAVAEDSERR